MNVTGVGEGKEGETRGRKGRGQNNKDGAREEEAVNAPARESTEGAGGKGAKDRETPPEGACFRHESGNIIGMVPRSLHRSTRD
eukprot:1647964-Pleurochrysis_carterae.AAC.2